MMNAWIHLLMIIGRVWGWILYKGGWESSNDGEES